MINKLLSIYKPEVYHGRKEKDSFFEGWYFKLSNKELNKVYAVIPGIFKSGDKTKEHAFIQINDGVNNLSDYIVFPASDFHSEKNRFDIRIGESRFTSSNIELKVKGNKVHVEGNLNFTDLKPWRRSILAPGIMGWYSYVPFMECNHSIISMDHIINGILSLNGEELNLTGGRGYIEKDWGTSFPSSYVWMQSNHYSRPGVSLMASIANIPWIRSSFRGFIIALKTPEKDYLFATYNSSELIRLNVNKNNVLIEAKNKYYKLRLEADWDAGATLYAPYDGVMKPRVIESLKGLVHTLITDNKGKIIFEGNGLNAGIETNGKLEEIITA